MQLERLDDLTALWEGIAEWCEHEGLPLYPSVPLGEGVVAAEWPGGSPNNWIDFFTLAQRVQCKLVYGVAPKLTEDDLEGAEDLDLGPLLEVARAHLGQPRVIVLAFVLGGVLHLWEYEPEWSAALRSGDEDEQEEGETHPSEIQVEAEVRRLEQEIPDWEGMLLASKEFLSGRTRTQRREAIGNIIPQMRDWLEIMEWETRDPAVVAQSRVAFKAWQLAEQRVEGRRAEIVAVAKKHEGDLLQQLSRYTPFVEAGSSRERELRIKEFVHSELGFPSPDLTLRLLTLSRGRPLSEGR